MKTSYNLNRSENNIGFIINLTTMVMMMCIEVVKAQDAAPIGNIKVTPPHTNSSLPRPSQDTFDALSGQLKSQITPCWNPPKGSSESGVKVTLDVQLNKDGTLGGEKIVVVTGISHPLAKGTIESAKEALKECAAHHPFKLPAESYSMWATSRITFDPSRP